MHRLMLKPQLLLRILLRVTNGSELLRYMLPLLSLCLSEHLYVRLLVIHLKLEPQMPQLLVVGV